MSVRTLTYRLQVGSPLLCSPCRSRCRVAVIMPRSHAMHLLASPSSSSLTLAYQALDSARKAAKEAADAAEAAAAAASTAAIACDLAVAAAEAAAAEARAARAAEEAGAARAAGEAPATVTAEAELVIRCPPTPPCDGPPGPSDLPPMTILTTGGTPADLIHELHAVAHGRRWLLILLIRNYET